MIFFVEKNDRFVLNKSIMSGWCAYLKSSDFCLYLKSELANKLIHHSQAKGYLEVG
jgi:hypothetical protein